MFSHPYSRHDMELAQAVVRSALHPHHRYSNPDSTGRIFVTVSRQAGAAGRPLARELVRRLNQSPGDPWSAWDQELVEKVSSEHHIEAALVDLMEDRRHTWFGDFLQGLSANSNGHPDELKVYRRVATTIRALAVRGHAVIVGRGGAFITAGLAGGIHVRLVSPLAHRISHLSQDHGLSERQAAAEIARTDQTRQAFYHRFWPSKPLGPESFTLTLNTAELSLDEMVECVAALVQFREQHSGLPRVHATSAAGAQQPAYEGDRARAV